MVALAETRSVSRAASLIGLSQPAASNALTRLRDATGDQLFVRSKNGMIPTAYAETILPGVCLHLHSLFHSLTGHADFDPKASDRTFRLSLSGLGELVFLPRLLAHTLRSAPHIRIENRSAPALTLAKRLESGEIDCAVGLIDLPDRGIQSEPLFNETYVAVAGGGLEGEPQSLDDLRHERLIISAPSASYGADLTRFLKKQGLTENIIVQLANFGALAQMLDCLPLISILPKQFACQLAETGGARILPVRMEQTKVIVRLVWHERTDHDPACIWLRSVLTDLYKDA